MNAFEEIIGYEEIKEELTQVLDMLKHRDLYDAMGSKPPRGILLYGEPGLGKTLMAECFLKECGLPSRTIRRNKEKKDFIKEISDSFHTASQRAPYVLFLDDLDKFANEDEGHRDAEEYVAIQSGIDEVKDLDVLVLATANEIDKLPNSLVRSGRFDKKIRFHVPEEKDAEKLIDHYLKGKKVSQDVNCKDLVKMINFFSSAEMENILNEAGIYAAFERKNEIQMEHLVRATIKRQYGLLSKQTKASEKELYKRAVHEAGHLVVSEMLCPDSVGFASIHSQARNEVGGFIHTCKNHTILHTVMVALAGKAAVELNCPDSADDGCRKDLNSAFTFLMMEISENGSLGLPYVSSNRPMLYSPSEALMARWEDIAHGEMERLFQSVRDILIQNRAFLEIVAEELMEKENLLFSDIQKIKEDIYGRPERIEATASA